MNIISIIPARMGSSRFPGKPMKKILGMPMIGHVYNRVKMCKTLNEVYVATCDQEIFDYIESIGGNAVMTSKSHERCSDRCAEAMLKIEEKAKKNIDIMVMVQGDEPLTFPQMIEQATRPLIEKECSITNLIADIRTKEEFESPNEIKVVTDKNNFALYFSREPIPSAAKYDGEIPMKKQVCVIPFNRDFLIEYNQMAPTELEIIESVDMMRVLENNIKLKMVPTDFITKAVDTPEDIKIVEKMLQSDELVKQYL